ncbi:MAG: hypothetical protein L3J71_04175 [Victivallaceae bacterium]|nr:hypothetical protein [Victivallaceae bacterium]
MSITQNGKVTANYDYHISGQIAFASILTTEGTEHTDNYEWDGLALIKRGTTNLTNEPAATGGNPILADNSVLFNNMLGTTLGVIGSKGEKSFASTATTAFGESSVKSVKSVNTFFTGKPHVAGLGYAFLFRNYRANLGKWQTADPLGYPDGWNNLAYCNNRASISVDPLGLYGKWVTITGTRAVITWTYDVVYQTWYDSVNDLAVITQTINYHFNVISYWDKYDEQGVVYDGKTYDFYRAESTTTSIIDYSAVTDSFTPGQLTPEEVADVIALLDGSVRDQTDEALAGMNSSVTMSVYLIGTERPE